MMSGFGLVVPCDMLLDERYKRFRIGDVKEQLFKDEWSSDEFKDVMDHLASDKFDVHRQCAKLCLQEKVNEAINDLLLWGISLP